MSQHWGPAKGRGASALGLMHPLTHPEGGTGPVPTRGSGRTSGVRASACPPGPDSALPVNPGQEGYGSGPVSLLLPALGHGEKGGWGEMEGEGGGRRVDAPGPRLREGLGPRGGAELQGKPASPSPHPPPGASPILFPSSHLSPPLPRCSSWLAGNGNGARQPITSSPVTLPICPEKGRISSGS